MARKKNSGSTGTGRRPKQKNNGSTETEEQRTMEHSPAQFHCAPTIGRTMQISSLESLRPIRKPKGQKNDTNKSEL